MLIHRHRRIFRPKSSMLRGSMGIKQGYQQKNTPAGQQQSSEQQASGNEFFTKVLYRLFVGDGSGVVSCIDLTTGTVLCTVNPTASQRVSECVAW